MDRHEVQRRKDDRMVPAHDTQLASRFGDRRPLVTVPNAPFSTDEAIEEMVDKLDRWFTPGHDMLLLIGSPMICSLAFTYCSTLTRHDRIGHVKVHMWSQRMRNRRGDYTVIDVPIWNLTTV